MKSELLEANGLINLVGGIDYNFRMATAKDTFAADVERLIEAAGIKPDVVYTGTQVHGPNVSYGSGDNGDEFIIGRNFPDSDGLITDQKNIALLVKYADCTPVVLYDPVKKVTASVHSGWRSTVQKISHVAIQKMVDDFGCELKDILAYVGPSIAQENYEVGPEVYEAFSGEPDRELYFKEHGEKYLLDMSASNVQLLIKAGILPENMEVEQAKTFGNNTLHSAREEGENYGLNGIITMMV